MTAKRPKVSSGLIQPSKMAIGKEQRQNSAEGRADVGQKTQKSDQHAPEQGAGNADEMQAGTDQRAVADIDEQLQTKITADAGGGVVDGLGHDVQAAVTTEGDQAITKIFAADQHKKSEDDDDAESADYAQNALERIERQRGRGDDFDRHGPLPRRSDCVRVPAAELPAGGAARSLLISFMVSEALLRAVLLDKWQGFEFGVNVGTIVGELVHDLGELLADGPAHGADDYKG